MGAAIALRDDFDGPGLRRLAKAAKDAGQSRRCLALAGIYDDGARSDAARMSGVGLQVIRDWVLRLGATRNPAQGAPGPTYPVGLYLRRHLSRARRRGGPRPASLQHPGHAMASR